MVLISYIGTNGNLDTEICPRQILVIPAVRLIEFVSLLGEGLWAKDDRQSMDLTE